VARVKETTCMATPLRRRHMTADEFIAWAMEQPEGHRYELVAGEIVAMSPERASHNEGKGNVYVALREAIRARDLPCRAYTDGMAVRIDDDTVYEPDALVRCGERLGPDVVEIDDPSILVEVVSPSSRKVDTGIKLTDYFRLPSLRHYLVVNMKSRSVTHHERQEGGAIQTRIVKTGPLTLEPPGLVLDVATLFED
jgi:Uma2 family endonuclease